MAKFQGQVVETDSVSTRNKRDFIGHLREQQNEDFPLLSAPDYGSVSFLSGFKPNQNVQSAIEIASSTLSSETLTEAQQYVHTSTIVDSSLLVPAFNKLATKPIKPINRRLLKRMILINLLTHKRENGKYVTTDLEFSPQAMASFNKNSGSASGILPMKPVHGLCSKVSGTKGEMHTSALQVNIRDRISEHIPCSIPFKPFFKSEVVKKGKPVRGIQNESYANYMVLAMASTNERLFDKGIAIGMGKKGEGLQSIFMYWYVIYRTETGKTWLEFLDYLREMGAHESDKVAWEASTNGTDGLAYIFTELNTKRFATPGDKRLYLRALIDTCNPFVYIDRCGFWAPWRIPSGTYLTSSGNSKRHRLMNLAVADYIQSHSYQLGSAACDCEACNHLRTSGLQIGLSVSRLSLKLRKHAFILGDDYIAVSMGKEQDKIFDSVMDFYFGTTTKTEFKQMFESAEFLRRKFTVINHMIHPYKDSPRVVAKLIHGMHRTSVERFCAAVYSAMFEIGPNKELEVFLETLKKNLHPDDELLQSELQKYRYKSEEVADVFQYTDFSNADIINYYNRPIETLINVLKNMKFY